MCVESSPRHRRFSAIYDHNGYRVHDIRKRSALSARHKSGLATTTVLTTNFDRRQKLWIFALTSGSLNTLQLHCFLMITSYIKSTNGNHGAPCRGVNSGTGEPVSPRWRRHSWRCSLVHEVMELMTRGGERRNLEQIPKKRGHEPQLGCVASTLKLKCYFIPHQPPCRKTAMGKAVHGGRPSGDLCRLGGCVALLLLLHRSLGSRQSRDGHAVGGAAHVVESGLGAELHR